MIMRLPFATFVVAVATTVLLPSQAFAQKLGGGESLELPLGRLAIGLVLCGLIALGAVILLKRYRTEGRFPLLFRAHGAAKGRPAKRVRVLETHRLSQHADLCRFVSNDIEYLVIVSPGATIVLSQTPSPEAPRTEGAS